jgi:uncharacterized protein (TIGR00661 family)
MVAWMEEATRHEPHVQLMAIPSLHFRYYENGKLSYVKSCCSAIPFLARLRRYLGELCKTVDEFNPHLAIVDFEPLLPRVTRQLGITTLSLDHQHFLAALDFATLPWNLRLRAQFLQPSVRLFCPWADAHLVSSFYRFPQRSGTFGYRQVGVLIREELGQLASQVEDHLVVYLRRQHAGPWLKYLDRLAIPCAVYGLDQEGVAGNLHFKQIGSREFLRDLVTCRCLISTAGNQLIGEALAVGKPVLAIPEQGNFEQQINGHFLQASGLGECCPPARVSPRELQGFLDRLPMYRQRIGTQVRPGNEAVMQQIKQMIPVTTPVPQVEANATLVSAGANA